MSYKPEDVKAKNECDKNCYPYCMKEQCEHYELSLRGCWCKKKREFISDYDKR